MGGGSVSTRVYEKKIASHKTKRAQYYCYTALSDKTVQTVALSRHPVFYYVLISYKYLCRFRQIK